mgnify:CR=1 FL=1
MIDLTLDLLPVVMCAMRRSGHFAGIDQDFAESERRFLDRLREGVGAAYAAVLRDFSAETMGEIHTLSLGWPG